MLLNVENLIVSYGAVEVVRGVDFSVNEGEVVTVLGANGAGKTTILKALCGLIPIGDGRVTYEGQPIANLPAHEIVDKGIAMVPEGRQLFPHLSVKDNLMLGAYRNGARQKWREQYEDILQMFPRLRERLEQMAGSLSGGEQQMVAIGRGLMSRPKLLIFDEPSLGLSPLLVDQMFEVIRNVAQRGVTVIIVEQNVFHTLKIADRGYILESGRVALTGTGAALLTDPKVKKAYLGH